jgi:hypothetical protein
MTPTHHATAWDTRGPLVVLIRLRLTGGPLYMKSVRATLPGDN